MAVREVWSHVGVLAALESLGIGDIRNINRVIIDLKVDSIPVVHVQYAGDDRVLDVIEEMANIPIEIKKME